MAGLGGRLVDTFARQLGGRVARESGNTGTIVCLTLPSREAFRRLPSYLSRTSWHATVVSRRTWSINCSIRARNDQLLPIPVGPTISSDR